MFTEIILFDNGSMAVCEYDDVVYFKIYGDYTDNDALKVAQYTEKYCQCKRWQTPRIYDYSDAENFLLTQQESGRFDTITQKIKQMWPGSSVYLIANNAVGYSAFSLFQSQASDEKMPIHVLRCFDELPAEIKNKIKVKKTA